MADSPVKTNIMVALGTALTAVTELKTINRYRGKPIDLDVEPLPALYFHDEGEGRKRNNLLQLGVIDLILTVFMPIPVDDLGDQKFSDDADIIQAKVHGIMFGTENLKNMGVLAIQEIEVAKDYPDGTYGILVMRYEMTYAHKFGNAFNKDAI